MSGGWYLMHRGWMDSPDFQAEPFTERDAFIWSIEQAAFNAHFQWFNRVQYPVERGEFVTSIRKMAVAFQWGEGRVRGFIARMERCKKWTLRTTQGGTQAPRILRVCNYETFQTFGEADNTAGSTANSTAGTQPSHSLNTQQNEGTTKANEGKRIEEASASARAPALPYSEAIEAWSQIAALKGWSPVSPTLPLSAKRQRGLGSILKVHGLPGWVSALQRAADGEVLGGPDPPAWFGFDFMCDPNKFPKVKDGNYDRSFGNQSRQHGAGSAWLDARNQLSGAI